MAKALRSSRPLAKQERAFRSEDPRVMGAPNNSCPSAEELELLFLDRGDDSLWIHVLSCSDCLEHMEYMAELVQALKDLKNS
jgi:hypothetical protein